VIIDGFLKHHVVPLEYSIEDFEQEGATSARSGGRNFSATGYRLVALTGALGAQWWGHEH
jgi:hypothetical protein